MESVLFLTDDKKREDKFLDTVLGIFRKEEKVFEVFEYKDLYFTFDYRNSEFNLFSQGKKLNLKDYKSVFFFPKENGYMYDYFNFFISQLAIKSQVPYHATHRKRVQWGNKLIDMYNLAVNGLPVPLTLYQSSTDKESICKNAESVLKYPFILKKSKSSKGKDVHLIENRDELMGVLEDIKIFEWIFQEYIPNNGGYRVVVTDGEVRVFIERIPSEGNFRDNAAQGAEEVFHPVEECPKEMADIAKKASMIVEKNIAGIDIAQNSDTEDYYIFEVNGTPGITVFEDGSSMEAENYVDFISNMKLNS
jgi:glutathione synthase/RimK-type ligase-like ATP-grasp enzyme